MVTTRKPKRRSVDTERLASRLAIVEAEHAALRASLQAVLATLSDSEWSTEETKAVRRQARAVVEETGGGTNNTKGER